MRWAYAIGAGALALAACGLFSDLGSLAGSEGDEAGADGSGPPPTARPCSGGGYCRVAAPSGWEGPGVVDGECAAPFTARVASLHEGLDAGAEWCACGCTPPNTQCQYLVERFSGNVCDGPQGVGTVRSSSDCWTNTRSLRVLDASVVSLGSCKPYGDAGKDPPAWARSAGFCAGSFFTKDCPTGELCVTSPAARVCVARLGEHVCPGAPYTSRRVYFQGFEDTRGCGACACGPPEGCIPVKMGRLNPCPGGTPSPMFVNDAGCLGPFEYVNALPTGSCAPSPASKVGDVKPTQPVTVCCEP